MIINNNPLLEYAVTASLNYRTNTANQQQQQYQQNINSNNTNNNPNQPQQPNNGGTTYIPYNPVQARKDEIFRTKRTIMAGEIYSKYSPDGGRPFWDWQQDLVNELYKGTNAFVAIKAGGGKTTPCISFWLNKYLLGIDTPSQGFVSYFLNDKDKYRMETDWAFDKRKKYFEVFERLFLGNIKTNIFKDTAGIVFVAPIKVLAGEQANGFAQVFADLFLYLNDEMERVLSTYLIDINKYRNPAEINSCVNIMKYILKELHKFEHPNCYDYESICNKCLVDMHIYKGSFEEHIINDIRTKKIPVIKQNGNFENIFFRYTKLMNLFTDQFMNGGFFNVYNERFFGNGGRFLSICKEHIHRVLISVLTGGETTIYNDKMGIAPKSLAVIATYEKLANNPDIVRNSRVIVFDEAHMYQPATMFGTSNQNDTMKAMECMYKILKASDANKTQILFLSGTINPVSAKNLLDDIKSKVSDYKNKKFEVVANDTGGNPSNIHIIQDDSLLNVKDVINNATKMIKYKNGHNCFIYFSKKQILNICSEIMNKVDNVGLKNIEKGREDWTKYRSRGGQNELLNDYNIQSRADIINNNLLSNLQAQNIKNQFLRQVVAHGFGYIISNDTNDPYDDRLGKITEEDKMIVAKLFSEGKIYVLFATSAIGIGVNVDIHNLYLPSLETYVQGKLMSPEKRIIDMRTLNQLINRTGRGKVDHASVHTPKGNIAYVEQIVHMNTDEYADIPRFYK